jgi:hypothetical protein
VLRRIQSKLALRRRRPGFHSAFGGLWPDRPEAAERIARRRAAGELCAADAELLAAWIRDGFVILPGAVPGAVLDGINAEVDEAWRTGDPRRAVELDGVKHAIAPQHRGPAAKLLDLYVHADVALAAAFAEPIRRFLGTLFEREILLFQGLSFEYGSQQEVHQDTTYVVVESPLELAAAWIALEDVLPGSGELVYYPGSHRLPDTVFAGGGRNYNKERDGEAAHRRYLDGLHARSRAQGLELRAFLPKRGDVLIWSADLAHGGARVADRARTRRSFVCHYAPLDVAPYYFSYLPARRRIARFAPGCHYCSGHYPLER